MLTSAEITDGRPRTVTYQADALGQVIRRDEGSQAGGKVGPHEVWLRFDGRRP